MLTLQKLALTNFFIVCVCAFFLTYELAPANFMALVHKTDFGVGCYGRFKFFCMELEADNYGCAVFYAYSCFAYGWVIC